MAEAKVTVKVEGLEEVEATLDRCVEKVERFVEKLNEALNADTPGWDSRTP